MRFARVVVCDAAPRHPALRVGIGLVAAALVLVTIANGATSLMKRIGVLDRERYETYWRVHCGNRGATFRVLGLGRRCLDADPGPLEPQRYQRDVPYFRFVFDVERADVALKLGKDVFLLMFIVGSLAFLAHGWATLPRGAWPLWGLCILVSIASVAGFASGHWLSTLAGLRGTTFLAVAVLGAWMTCAWGVQRIERAMVVLSLLQIAVVPLELVWGMPISGYTIALSLPNRLAGTLVKPNTLGVLAVVTVAAAEAFEPARAWRRLAWVAGVVLVASAGSATGWILLAALALHHERIRVRTPARLAAVGAATLVLVVALPKMVGRPDVYDSLVGTRGRVGALREAFAGETLWTGEGLVTSPPESSERQSLSSLAAVRPRGTDSTLILLIQEFGVPGAVLFYVALIAAWRRDDAVRPLLLAVGLGSLTLNMAFAFPMNFLLGLALARGFASPTRASGGPS